MNKLYPTNLIRKLTGATDNQLKYWVKIGLINPEKRDNTFFYSFRDIIKLRLIVALKEKGLSLQKIRKGIQNLSKTLPESDEALSKLIIFTNGSDMIISEKGKYFSAITMQLYFTFDTEQIETEVIEIQKLGAFLPKTASKRTRVSR